MNLVNMKELLDNAQKGGYAVPQFNINNLEWTKAILMTAEKNNSPVILGGTKGAIDHIGGYHTVVNMTKGLIMDLGITVQVVIHLDHGSSYEECKKAIDAGFTSVMIDASRYPIGENITISKSVSNYAHSKGVSVEAEVGTFDFDAGIKSADVDDCVRLAECAEIDCLAPSLGSVHGINRNIELDFTKMSLIGSQVNVPMSLHGGSGIPENSIKEAIKYGCHKININTENMAVWAGKVREFLKLDQDEIHPRKIINSGVGALEKNLESRIEMFGSYNKSLSNEFAN